MPWVRVDDKVHSHPKIIAVGNAAVGLWVRLLTYHADYGKGSGVITRPVAVAFARDGGRATEKEALQLLEDLVNARLLELSDDGLGYVVHDWKEYTAEAKRAKKAQQAKDDADGAEPNRRSLAAKATWERRKAAAAQAGTGSHAPSTASTQVDTSSYTDCTSSYTSDTSLVHNQNTSYPVVSSSYPVVSSEASGTPSVPEKEHDIYVRAQTRAGAHPVPDPVPVPVSKESERARAQAKEPTPESAVHEELLAAQAELWPDVSHEQVRTTAATLKARIDGDDLAKRSGVGEREIARQCVDWARTKKTEAYAMKGATALAKALEKANFVLRDLRVVRSSKTPQSGFSGARGDVRYDASQDPTAVAAMELARRAIEAKRNANGGVQ